MPDLSKLVADLKNVTDWFLLSINLGIKHPDLKKLESIFKDNIERCKTEMLHFWMKSCDNVSVTELTTALENSDHCTLARQIQEKYNVPQTGMHIASICSICCAG